MSTAIPALPAALVTTNRLWTTRELAQKVRRTEQTVRAWVHDEGLPVHRINGRMLFDPAEFDVWERTRTGRSAEDFTADDIDEHIRQLVDLFPPLSETQIERVAQLLRAGAA